MYKLQAGGKCYKRREATSQRTASEASTPLEALWWRPLDKLQLSNHRLASLTHFTLKHPIPFEAKVLIRHILQDLGPFLGNLHPEIEEALGQREGVEKTGLPTKRCAHAAWDAQRGRQRAGGLMGGREVW